MSGARDETMRTLAAFFHAKREEIVARWMSRVRADPAVPRADELSALALRDHVPMMLDQLAVRLANAPDDVGAAEELGRELGENRQAREHAIHRTRSGYSLLEALRELSHLRAVLIEMTDEAGIALTGAAAMLVHAAIDDGAAMLAAEMEQLSLQYVAAREGQLRVLADEARRNAEEANRLKDHFLATVSHELRTPLNAMLGWMRMLRAGTLSPERRERALETVERNVVVQAQLVEDLLDVSRIAAGKLTLEMQPVAIVEVVEAAIEVVRPAADAKNVRLHPVLDANAGVLTGDPRRLQQVVWNLLSNAVKFTPDGGRVRMVLERCDGATVKLVVEDTGVGIAADFLPYVFDQFRQEGDTAVRAGGLGLGLSIVKTLVELHGGAVTAESAGPGQGTMFTVVLPARTVGPRRVAAQVERESLEAGSPPELAGVRVLVVEDDPDTRELIASVLESCAMQVTTASNVNDALEQFKREVPQLLVTDIAMPGGDGYLLVKTIRGFSDAEGRRTPAIAVTAFARAEDRTAALRAGFNMHLAKPIEPAELVAVVASVMSRWAPEPNGG